jgi:hypothetical protein
MSYPVIIPNTITGYDFSANATARYGFEYNGNQYAFLSQGSGTGIHGDFKVHVMKSTDVGLTWAEMDSSHAVTVGPRPSYGSGYYVFQDGATAYMAFLTTSLPVSGNITVTAFTIYTFNLSTDTWGSAVSTVNTVLPDFVYRGNTVGGSNSRETFVSFVVRAPGDYIMYYAGAPLVSGGKQYGRAWEVSFDGTTFGTPTQIPGQSSSNGPGGAPPVYWPLGAVSDSTRRTWFMYMGNTEDAGSSVDFNVYGISMDSGGSFDSVQAMPSPNGYLLNTRGMWSPPIIYTPTGGIESVGFVGETTVSDFSTQQIRFLYAPSTANPTWAGSNVTLGVDETSQSGGIAFSTTGLFPVPVANFFIPQAISLSFSSNTLVVTWTVTDDNFAGACWSSSAPADTLVWAAAALLFSTDQSAFNFPDFPGQAAEIYSYPATGGIAVVMASLDTASGGFANNNEEAQFFFVSLTPIVTPPTCSLSASLTSILSGQSSTLTWTTLNTPTSAFMDQGIGAVSTTGGSLSVSPIITTTYHLTVTNTAGTSGCQATVTIIPPTPTGAPIPNQPVAGICAPHIDCLITLYKEPGDSKQYSFDWSGWMPSLDSITDAKWAISPGDVIIGASSFTGTATTVSLSGGMDGVVYILRNSVATSLGRVEVRSARLFVNIAHSRPPAAL